MPGIFFFIVRHFPSSSFAIRRQNITSSAHLSLSVKMPRNHFRKKYEKDPFQKNVSLKTIGREKFDSFSILPAWQEVNSFKCHLKLFLHKFSKMKYHLVSYLCIFVILLYVVFHVIYFFKILVLHLSLTGNVINFFKMKSHLVSYLRIFCDFVMRAVHIEKRFTRDQSEMAVDMLDGRYEKGEEKKPFLSSKEIAFIKRSFT